MSSFSFLLSVHFIPIISNCHNKKHNLMIVPVSGSCRARTDDPLIKSQLLCQLS